MPYLGNEVAPLVQALEGKELKLDSDGDSSIQASTDDIVVLKTNSNTALSIDANGHVTKPLQSAFLVKPNTSLNNTAVGTTIITFATEVYDVNGDFASNTFTAPVTAKYHFNLHMRLDQIDVSSDYYQLRLVTSNRIYYAIFDPDLADGDFEYFTLVINVLADMDAGDTAYGDMQISGGSAKMDMKQDSHFSGFLAC